MVVTEFFFFTVTEFSLIDAVSGESRRRRVENEFIYFFFFVNYFVLFSFLFLFSFVPLRVSLGDDYDS